MAAARPPMASAARFSPLVTWRRERGATPEDCGSDLPLFTATPPVTNCASAEIIRYARDAETDLIVMGTHGRTGFGRLLIGSVAEHVVRHAPCPVLTIKHPEHEFVMP